MLIKIEKIWGEEETIGAVYGNKEFCFSNNCVTLDIKCVEMSHRQLSIGLGSQ